MKTPKQTKILHANTTSASVGEIFSVYDDSERASIQIEGNATGLNIGFEASIYQDASVWCPIEAVSVADSSDFSTTCTSPNKIYYIDVEPIRFLRVNVKAITGGSVKVICADYDTL